MDTRECDAQDQAADYALGLLRGAELVYFQAHLTACVACWVRAREMSAVVELLPTAAPPATPPAGLRARVLAVAGRTAQGNTGAQTTASIRLPGWALAALLLMGVGLAGLGLRLQVVTGQVERLAAVGLPGGKGATIALAATPQAPGAGGDLLVLPDSGGLYLVLRATGLPALSGEQVYHLWLLRDGDRTSGGTFMVNAEGLGGIAYRVPTGVRFDAVGITREPDPHGMAPRGQKVLGANLHL